MISVKFKVYVGETKKRIDPFYIKKQAYSTSLIKKTTNTSLGKIMSKTVRGRGRKILPAKTYARKTPTESMHKLLQFV